MNKDFLSLLVYLSLVQQLTPVAQGTEQKTSNFKVAGSSPAGRTLYKTILVWRKVWKFKRRLRMKMGIGNR